MSKIKLNSKERQEYDSLKAQGEKKKIERLDRIDMRQAGTAMSPVKEYWTDQVSKIYHNILVEKLNELIDRVNELTEEKK